MPKQGRYDKILTTDSADVLSLVLGEVVTVLGSSKIVFNEMSLWFCSWF